MKVYVQGSEAVAVLVGILALARGTPGEARDRSEALKASDLIGTKVQGTDGKIKDWVTHLLLAGHAGSSLVSVFAFIEGQSSTGCWTAPRPALEKSKSWPPPAMNAGRYSSC